MQCHLYSTLSPLNQPSRTYENPVKHDKTRDDIGRKLGDRCRSSAKAIVAQFPGIFPSISNENDVMVEIGRSQRLHIKTVEWPTSTSSLDGVVDSLFSNVSSVPQSDT